MIYIHLQYLPRRLPPHLVLRNIVPPPKPTVILPNASFHEKMGNCYDIASIKQLGKIKKKAMIVRKSTQVLASIDDVLEKH